MDWAAAAMAAAPADQRSPRPQVGEVVLLGYAGFRGISIRFSTVSLVFCGFPWFSMVFYFVGVKKTWAFCWMGVLESHWPTGTLHMIHPVRLMLAITNHYCWVKPLVP